MNTHNQKAPCWLINQGALETMLWVGFITMFIDHVGVMFTPDHYEIYRGIGRIAFPLFAFVFATRLAMSLEMDPKKNLDFMLSRLMASGFAAQFAWILYDPDMILNIMFLFAAVVLTISCLSFDKLENEKNISARLIITTIFLAYILPYLDYGYFGFILIVSAYAFLRYGSMIGAMLVIVCILIFTKADSYGIGVLGAVMAIGYIQHKNIFTQWKVNYLFYALYPAHILLLATIKLIK